jgi:hypothetical protein
MIRSLPALQSNRCVLLAALILAACNTPLETDWENDPSGGDTLSDPAAVSELIAGLYRLHVAIHHTSSGPKFGAHLRTLLTAVGDEVVTTNNVNGGQWDSSRGWPRAPFNNDPSAVNLTDPTGARRLWVALHEAVSNSNDVLWQIEQGMRLIESDGGVTSDQTDRGRAMAKLVQGISFGELAMAFDRAIVVGEGDLPLPAGNPAALRALVLQNLRPYPEVRDRALRSLDDAVSIARSNPSMVFPGALWGSSATGDVSSQQFVRLAHSYAARVLAYTPRRPEEREGGVDWERVVEYTEEVITADFGPVIGGTLSSSSLYGMLQGNSGVRLHYGTIGPADVSGRYQSWYTTPYADRKPFAIITPDRRVTGDTPTSHGSYVRYRGPSDMGDVLQGRIFTPHHSFYQWYRTAGETTSGTAVMIRADEIRLIRAEALVRRQQAEAAVPLVNVSRTRSHRVGGVVYPGLPPVTAAGVEPDSQCVPRTEAGACGSLLDAIRYERMLEGIGAGVLRAYADNRGWGRLTPGTWLHFPVPGQELVVLGQPTYTWGGIADQAWAAR